jgi:hypothetical protein
LANVSTAEMTSSSVAGPAEGLFFDRRALSLADRARARCVHVNVVASIIIVRRLLLLVVLVGDICEAVGVGEAAMVVMVGKSEDIGNRKCTPRFGGKKSAIERAHLDLAGRIRISESEQNQKEHQCLYNNNKCHGGWRRSPAAADRCSGRTTIS